MAVSGSISASCRSGMSSSERAASVGSNQWFGVSHSLSVVGSNLYMSAWGCVDGTGAVKAHDDVKAAAARGFEQAFKNCFLYRKKR